MSLTLLGIGTAVPPYSIGQPEAARLAKSLYARNPKASRFLEIAYERTQIRKRGSVLLDSSQNREPRQSFFPPAQGEFDHGPTTKERMERYAKEAGTLALSSARPALQGSGLTAGQMTHLVTISCTGFEAPGFDMTLIRELGLDPDIARTHIGYMGCHGAINGLRVAQALVDASPSSVILLSSVELCSLHFSYDWDPEKIIVNGLFADGSGAVVGAWEGEGSNDFWKVKATGSTLFPNSEEAMSWRIGNHGFEMTLSSTVPDLIAAHLRPWLEAWLARKGLTLREIRSWAIHPGGPRVLDAVSESLDLSNEAASVSRQILTEFGNMSSATIVFIIDRLRCQGAPRPCLALAFGPGLAVEVALLG